MPQTRQLAAILFTDIVGYTALLGSDGQKLCPITKSRELQLPIMHRLKKKYKFDRSAEDNRIR